MNKGYYFEINYNIEIRDNEDVAVSHVTLYESYEKCRVEDMICVPNGVDYSRWFYDDEKINIKDVELYLSKTEIEYEYIPRKFFIPFNHAIWDTDDFNNEDDYFRAEEQSIHEYLVEKVDYSGFILCEDRAKVDEIIEDLKVHFNKENGSSIKFTLLK